MNNLNNLTNKLVSFVTSSVFFSNFVTFALVLLLMATSFGLGALYTQVRVYTGNFNPGAVVNNQGTQAGNNAAGAVPDVAKPDTSREKIRGSKNAQIALIEYSDFDCPFCERFHVTAKQALEEYGDKLMWVYRHYPITSLHPDAKRKAEASECIFQLAGNDKFWSFADILYETPDKLAEIYDIAARVGVDATKFKDCYDNKKTAAAIDAEMATGTKAGVRGTPGIYIVNLKTNKIEVVPGAVPFETLKQSIEAVL